MFTGLLAVLLLTMALLVAQRGLHRETHAVFLLLTRRPEISIVLFSILFFPGVLLHEGSHYLAARLLRVRTGGFSLLPRLQKGGRLQLGYVETAVTDPLRESLIGMAPLLTGGLFVAYAGLTRLGLLAAWEAFLAGGLGAAMQVLPDLYARPDFWLWFYLAFAVSSTMLPSASDRRAWLPVSLAAGLLIGLALILGAGPWMAATLALPFNRFLGAMAAVFAVSLALHLLTLLPAWLAHRVLSRLTGLEVK